MIGYPIDSHVTYDEAGVPVYDRAVSSVPLRKLIKMLFSDGVMPNPSTNLQVAAGTGMNVIVKPGFAICNGCMKLEEEQATIAVRAADASYDRIDAIVLRLDDNDAVRSCELAILTGTPSVNPTRPALTRNASVWEIGLADIKISANSTAVTNVYITDTRYETARCGVISSISEFDTTKIYQQILADLASFKTEEQANFLAWFAEMQNQLGTDAAGNLQNQINAERERINNLAKLENGSTTGDAELQDIRIGTHGEVFQTAGEAVRTQIGAIHKEYAYIPITTSSSGLRLDTSIIESGYTIGETLMNNMIRTVESEGYCIYTREVKKGESLVFTNAFSMTHDSVMYVFDSDRIVQNVVYPQIIQRDYNEECIFGQDGYVFIKFNYSNIASGEFFYIKQPAFLEPLVLYANKAEEYLVDAAVGDEVIRAIMRSRNIHIRVPNADGNNYTAVYSPVLMYQLPNYMNEYVYLFFLNDGINAETGMPTFSQLKILTSHTYNMTPLI